MLFKSRLKDARRRRLLRRHGIAVEVDVPLWLRGARSGTWPVVRELLGERPRMLSFGVGDNAAWDRSMVEELGAEVHAFDPTPQSVAWVRARQWPAGFVFHEVGIAGHDGTLRVAPPRRTGKVNFLSLPRDWQGEGVTLEVPVQSLGTVVAELGWSRVDVLKMDVEGAEYGVLAAGPFPVPVGQVLVEFHHGVGPYTFDDTRVALRVLADQGYRILWISKRGLEFAFAREDLLAAAGFTVPDGGGAPPRPET